MSYIEKYKARMAKQGDGSNRSLRNRQAKDTYNRHFKDTIGYREATVWDRESVEKGWINEVSLDVIVETNTMSREMWVRSTTFYYMAKALHGNGLIRAFAIYLFYEMT